jgi:hypothetical protein
LQTERTDKDHVEIIQREISHYIRPHDSNLISIYLPCDHGAGMTYFEHPADPKEIRKQLNDACKAKQNHQCFQ